MLALAMAVFQADIRATVKSAPAPEPSLGELAIDAGKHLIREKFLGQKEKAPISNTSSDNLHDWVQIIYMSLGVIGIFLGIISWINKENMRISGSAVSLGFIVAAWQYTVIAIGIAVVIILVSYLAD